MKTRILLASLAGVILLAIAGAAAQNSIPNVINFAGNAAGGGSENIHPSIYTGPITFTHQKHIKEYGASCGDCHHDSDHEPIIGANSGDSFNCADCHDEEGLIRGPIAENGASRDDIIAHRSNVIHILCIECHKKYNATKHVVVAPEACRICHTKRPQDWIIE